MRTRDEIRNEILNNLTGIAWQKLRNSLLGNELISFGATVTEVNDAAYYTLLSNLAPDTADYIGLAVLAASVNECFDVVRPAQVILEAPANCKPFDLCLTIAGVTFYNTQYVVEHEQCTLYAGSIQEQSIFLRKSEPNVYQLNGYKYIKLPSETIIDSIEVKAGEFNVPLSDKEGRISSIKLWRDEETNLNASILGWISDEFKFKYLLGYSELPSIDAGTLTWPTGSQSWKGKVYEGSKEIEVARNSLIEKISQGSAISTKEQIIQAVNQFPQVKDCNPELLQVGEIKVWIKPSQENLKYDAISKYLSIYGEMAVKWSAEEGYPTLITARLSELSSLTAEQKAEVKDKLLERAEDIKFTTVVTPAWLLAATPDYNTSVSVELITDTQLSVRTGQKLPAIPVEGSIRIILEGSEVGWDNRGYIRGYVGVYKPTKADLNVAKIGELFVVPHLSDRSTLLIKQGRDCAKILSSMWNAYEAQVITTNDSYALLQYPEGFQIFGIDTKFTAEGQNSLIRDPDQAVLQETPQTGFIDQGSETISFERILVGKDIFTIEEDALSEVVLSRYRLAPDNTEYYLYGSKQSTKKQGKIRSILNLDGRVLVFVGDSCFSYQEAQNPELLFVDTDLLDQALKHEPSDNKEYVAVAAKGKSIEILVRELVDVEKKVYKYNLYTCDAGVQGTARLVFRPLTSVKQQEFPEAVDCLGFGIYRGESAVYNSKAEPLWTLDGHLNMLEVAGVVDYQRATVSISVPQFDDAIIRCSSTELKQVEASNYPVIESVIWK